MVHGFFFGMGFFASFIVILIILRLVKKVLFKRPTVKMWKEYKRKIIENEQYGEADFVSKLIEGKDDDDKTPLPKGYKIEEKARTVLNDQGDEEVSISIEKDYWIVKTKRNK